MFASFGLPVTAFTSVNGFEIKMSRRESIDGSKLVLAYRYIKAHYKQKAIKVKSENQYDLHVIGLNVYLILFTTCLLYCTCYLF